MTGTVIVLALQGRLTSVPHPGATAVEVLARIRVVRPRIILDLGSVPIVDCSGIGLIAALCRAARDRGGDLLLLRLRERQRRLLEMCGLLRVVQSFETEEAALASIIGPDHPEVYLERVPVCLGEPWWCRVGFGLARSGLDVASNCSGRMTA